MLSFCNRYRNVEDGDNTKSNEGNKSIILRVHLYSSFLNKLQIGWKGNCINCIKIFAMMIFAFIYSLHALAAFKTTLCV